MPSFLIIPDRKNMDESYELADRYGLGFEFNDFFSPGALDDAAGTDAVIDEYMREEGRRLPSLRTSHGDFFDVLVFSEDARIREISEERIRQSIAISEKLKAKGTIFHSNICAELHMESYINNWIDKNEAFWKRICAHFPDMEFYLENMFDSDPEPIRELAVRMKDVPNFGICLDYAHAALTTTSEEIWYESLAPYIRHMHINDNDLISDLHLAAGDGNIDYTKFKTLSEKYDTEGRILLEVNGIDNLNALINAIQSLPDVHSVKRIQMNSKMKSAGNIKQKPKKKKNAD